ncbi:MAG TPA: bifunctional phosphoglucose/phosphomannose isomerase [Candidatus Saccharimonadales bacterium]|nr:bifunctional phosphoglucose/phosphomannose isomerase [Candidatus Saccharimonadales bacterium]
MLDDLKLIHERDAQDALGVVEKQWQQLSHDFGVDASKLSGVDNIVLAGMGGSAWPAVYLQVWGEPSVPFEIVRDYTLPAYVGKNTLFISSSYSGNTEETLSALDEAEARGARIAVITAGGKLEERAKAAGHILYMIPGGIQPRMSSFFFLAGMVQLLEPLGLVPKGKLAELNKTGGWLKDRIGTWGPETPTAKNAAKRLALELMGKSVVAYSGPKMFPAANKFKICLNENAKNVAWVNQYPEFNHNEFIGWSSHPVDKPYAVVEIRSDLEHDRVQRRFVVSERLLSGKRPAPHVIKPEGKTHLEQLLWTSNFCDFVSVYVAILNGLNPTPVDLVEKLKVELAK